MARDSLYIDPKSLKQFNKDLVKLNKVSTKLAYEAVIGIGLDMTNQAKLLLKGLHVVTSRLMNSIFLKVPGKNVMPKKYTFDGGSGDRDLNVVLTKNEIAYGTNVEYAQKIEDLDSYIGASTRIFERSAAYHLAKAARKIEEATAI